MRARSTSVRLVMVDKRNGVWNVEATFDISEMIRSGPLEIRDVTGDGQPDVVYRTFGEVMGHVWITANIYTRSTGMKPMTRSPVFRPEGRGDEAEPRVQGQGR